MVKDNLEDRIRAALLYTQGGMEVKEISSVMNVSVRTIRRWTRRYRLGGIKDLVFDKPGPQKGTNSIPDNLKERITRLKHRHPSWGQDGSSTSTTCRALENSTQDHPIKRHACANQTKTTAIKKIPEETRRFNVVVRHVSVPHFRHGKGVCHRIHR